jgi:hypothetical protein
MSTIEAADSSRSPLIGAAIGAGGFARRENADSRVARRGWVPSGISDDVRSPGAGGLRAAYGNQQSTSREPVEWRVLERRTAKRDPRLDAFEGKRRLVFDTNGPRRLPRETFGVSLAKSVPWPRRSVTFDPPVERPGYAAAVGGLVAPIRKLPPLAAVGTGSAASEDDDENPPALPGKRRDLIPAGPGGTADFPAAALPAVAPVESLEWFEELRSKAVRQHGLPSTKCINAWRDKLGTKERRVKDEAYVDAIRRGVRSRLVSV